MSASLMVFMPLVLLGLVTGLCFVGCALHAGGLDVVGPYQDKVLNDPNVVAFWPLNDMAELPDNPSGTPANDLVSTPAKFNGTYMGAAGTVKVQQQGIVTGDVPTDSTTASQCAFFNGGLVSVEFQPALNPAKFTLEAWVKPNWTTADAQVQRAVLVSATAAGAGYGLFARPDNFWEIQIGLGGGNFFPVQATQQIVINPPNFPNPVNYLAVTFDGITLKLFVGTVGGTFAPFSGNPPSIFVQEDSKATPSTATPLFIGMGDPDTGGANPFNGWIQDVAIYKDRLSDQTIMDHFNAGNKV